MKEESGRKPVMAKEELRMHIARSRAERYHRTALFIQTSLFIIGGGLAIAVIVLLIFLFG